MKKFFLLAAVAALTLNGTLWGQSITVTSPAAGAEWCLGNAYTITWTKSGAMPATVAVRLRRAGAPETEAAVLSITSSTANSGSLSWTIPDSVPAGDYFIRVRTTNPAVIGDSPNFKIKYCGFTRPQGRLERVPFPKKDPSEILQLNSACQITGIKLSPQDSVAHKATLTAFVTGKGLCAAFKINWGDGSPAVVVSNTNFDTLPAGLPLTHTYDYYGGWKTVRVEAVSPCIGNVMARILVEPKVYRLAYFASKTTACGMVPNAPEIRKNAIVTITTGPTKIDYGCLFGGCVYGPNGEPGSVAPADYSFPGLRKYSLVVRLGSQVEQGSYSFTFIAKQTAFMEVCVNDNVLSDNSGAWGVFIEVDESGL